MSERGLFESVAKMNNHVSNCHGIFCGVGFDQGDQKGEKDQKCTICTLFYEFRGFAGDFEEGGVGVFVGRNLKYVILMTNFDGMLIK